MRPISALAALALLAACGVEPRPPSDPQGPSLGIYAMMPCPVRVADYRAVRAQRDAMPPSTTPDEAARLDTLIAALEPAALACQ